MHCVVLPKQAQSDSEQERIWSIHGVLLSSESCNKTENDEEETPILTKYICTLLGVLY